MTIDPAGYTSEVRAAMAEADRKQADYQAQGQGRPAPDNRPEQDRPHLPDPQAGPF